MSSASKQFARCQPALRCWTRLTLGRHNYSRDSCRRRKRRAYRFFHPASQHGPVETELVDRSCMCFLFPSRSCLSTRASLASVPRTASSSGRSRFGSPRLANDARRRGRELALRRRGDDLLESVAPLLHPGGLPLHRESRSEIAVYGLPFREMVRVRSLPFTSSPPRRNVPLWAETCSRPRRGAHSRSIFPNYCGCDRGVVVPRRRSRRQFAYDEPLAPQASW